MNTTMQATTWFDGSRHAISLIEASIVFGGTHLLREFFSRVAAQNEYGRLVVVTPFLDAALLPHLSAFDVEKARITDLLLITTHREVRSSTARAIAAFLWHSCEIYALRGLHAKVFAAIPIRGTAVLLMGSHNLTKAGAFNNIEIGVLVTGTTVETCSSIHSLVDHVIELKAASRMMYDSLSSFPEASGHAA